MEQEYEYDAGQSLLQTSQELIALGRGSLLQVREHLIATMDRLRTSRILIAQSDRLISQLWDQQLE